MVDIKVAIAKHGCFSMAEKNHASFKLTGCSDGFCPKYQGHVLININTLGPTLDQICLLLRIATPPPSPA